MNIHSRFIFENRFYGTRQEGLVSEDKVIEMTVEVQKEGCQGVPATYHPYFWATKLHSFTDDVPFYNFPYIFGCLFSLDIYAYANQKGINFEEEYIHLLHDTTSMTTEDLAEKHLNVGLTQSDFWQTSTDMMMEDIQTFMELTEEFIWFLFSFNKRGLVQKRANSF